jgi:hypothetical protein
MKKGFLVLGILLIIFLAESCNETPETPSPPAKKANIVLDGDLQRTMTSYGCPQFEGYAKNTGNNTAYNCMVEIKCYSDTTKITIIDTASGFPSDLGDINPGQRAYFNAVAFKCNSHSQIVAYDVKITWLDR